MGRGEKEWCALWCVKHIQMIELMLVLILLMTFTRLVSMVLVLRGVGPILGNGYGIKGQYYAALHEGSEMLLGLHCKDLILGICFNIPLLCFSSIMGGTLVLNSDSLRLLPERAGNNFAFQL